MMRVSNLTARQRSIKELIVIASLLYGYLLLRNSFCGKVMDLDEDTTLNRILFRNTTMLYRYLLLPNISKCNIVKNEIAAVVLTTPERATIRQAIRKSWASPILSRAIMDGFATVFFFVGAPKSEWEMSRLLEEQESYHDLIITDIEESYENLVFKVNAIMQFFIKFCPKVEFLMKVDDDVSIHFDRMFTYWKESRHSEDKIYCRLWSGIPAIRDPSNKWFIPQKIWPRKTFPSYCDGPIYLLGRSAIHGILNLANHCHDPFPLEDVFYTGILASAVGIPRIDWRYKIHNVDELTWERHIYCDGPRNPVTFAISSFKTANSLMEAFHLLDSFRCYSNSTNTKVDNKN